VQLIRADANGPAPPWPVPTLRSRLATLDYAAVAKWLGSLTTVRRAASHAPVPEGDGVPAVGVPRAPTWAFADVRFSA
jgi:hypothetical protein